MSTTPNPAGPALREAIFRGLNEYQFINKHAVAERILAAITPLLAPSADLADAPLTVLGHPATEEWCRAVDEHHAATEQEARANRASLTASAQRVAELEGQLAACRANIVDMDNQLSVLRPVRDQIRADHKAMEGHNAGQAGMPQGPCQCKICKPDLWEQIDADKLTALSRPAQADGGTADFGQSPEWDNAFAEYQMGDGTIDDLNRLARRLERERDEARKLLTEVGKHHAEGLRHVKTQEAELADLRARLTHASGQGATEWATLAAKEYANRVAPLGSDAGDWERIVEMLPAIILNHLPAKRDGDGADRGIGLIAAERARQIAVEGWTPEHDDEHDGGEMRDAAACYTRHARHAPALAPGSWPWDAKWWKPSDDPIRNLVKAGALIAAEIDRLQRAAQQHGAKGRET